MVTNVAAGAAGAAVGGNTGAFTASNADMYNRQLHPDEKQKLAQLQKGETADERQRLADAACYQVQCAAQMSDNDPAKAAELASQQRGAGYITEQNELKATGLFAYSPGDFGLDQLNRGADALLQQAKSAGRTAANLGQDALNEIRAHGPQGSLVNPDDLGGPNGGGPTPPTPAVVTPSTVLATPAGPLLIPGVAVPGTPAYVPSTATLASGNDNRLPIPETVTADNGLEVTSNPKHTPGMRGNNPTAGTEPRNSLDLFNSSVSGGDSVRYAIDASGNINRFSSDRNGVFHWSGSTGDTSVPLNVSTIPIDVKRSLGFKGK
ncbi:MAG: Putative large exoprotein involved in heme utilization or adhesion of ShlA/HecA/FhaA family [uncultured Paraburkholderia sp.]|nr:MAG: Putative large exoprotein involved in heme utilization or adhesion of ShlA/HecA/FhaA family [uncultured Paraburkholderia sp.]CAH2934737.1 MAG: Putative large exoprotein involved in heme utilization or adhesion of ShlA/HecA/FhaA family [uncultured Paraburkholderia sp.]